MATDVIVSAQLPRALVDWLDLHLAERRIEILKAGAPDAPIPTRSSFIRDLLLKAKSNGNNHK